jgi:ssDNA-binding Zn-finger/Zn-ribbon topoisomerase 1
MMASRVFGHGGALEVLPDTNLCSRCKDAPRDPKPAEPDSCPRCGGVLVMRTPRQGLTKHFRGCSNFPQCRYTD